MFEHQTQMATLWPLLARWASPLFLLLCAIPLSAQTFSFALEPADPEPGDTVRLSVSLDQAWIPTGRGDTLHIVYAYSDFQFDPEQTGFTDSVSYWLDTQAWTSDVTIDTAARRVDLKLYFPEATGTADPGFLVRLGGLEIGFEDVSLRRGQPELEPAADTRPVILWAAGRLQVAAAGETLLREVWLWDMAGRQVGYWHGEAPTFRQPVPPTSGLLLVRVRTDRGDHTFRLMAR